jgi:dipeptidyl aminopeptidase/acylaminoacyl peptidase
VADLIGSKAHVGPRDLYSLPITGWCALNPARTAVAYAVTKLHEEANAYRGCIKVLQLPAQGAKVQAPASPMPLALTDWTARDQAPQWSCDGSRLFFLSDRSGRMQLYQVSATGGEVTSLPEVPGNVSEFAVSPAGRYLAAIATPTTNKEAIEQRGWRRITRIRYRSDGPGYLDDYPQLWLLDLQDDSACPLTDGSGFVAGVAFSPDGAHLTFSGEHGADADTLWRRELWVASAADQWKPREILTFASAIEAPSWSPDCASIAFCGIKGSGAGGAHNLRLFVASASGNRVECWTSKEEWTCGNFVLGDVSAAGSIAAPVWVSSDQITVLGSSRGSARVFLVSRAASSTALTPATMSVTYFAYIGPSCVLHCSSDQATPPELYIAEAGVTTRLTRETEVWNAHTSEVRTSHFTVPSGGIELDAWHVSGPGNVPRPCILYIHGGPHFAYGYAYVFHFVALAQAGFDVVFCNPRGSQSYGESFAQAIVGNWAQPAYEDCMAVLGAALQLFPIDREKLGVAGGSYGGYLTVWTIAHTSRFAAAVALRPAASLHSLWGTSEVGRMLAEDLGGSPFESPAVYAHDSPLAYVEQIRTPLLVIYGGQDYRTPAEQSEQLLTALLQRGALAEGLYFPNADHNISRSGPPRQRVLHEEAIIEWFTRFLLVRK